MCLWNLTNHALCTEGLCHVNILHFMYPVIMIEPQNHWEGRYFKEQDISLMYYTDIVLNVFDFRRAGIFFIKIVFAFSE